MIYYLFIGIIFSFIHNFETLFYEEEFFHYKIWVLIYVAFLFPIALLIRIININDKIKDEIYNNRKI